MIRRGDIVSDSEGTLYKVVECDRKNNKYTLEARGFNGGAIIYRTDEKEVNGMKHYRVKR